MSSRLAGFLHNLRGMIAPAGEALTDRRLLERFFRDGDQAAFAALVERHGGMVRGVCRRIVGDADADDAFQATFLVLASKGRSVRWRESIAGWLWAVAYRVAWKARTRGARRQRHESEAGRTMRDTHDPETPDDLRDVLHEELSRLPERYRLPLVLCYLEGQTTDQAAEQLRWPRGTVAGRLSRAREALRRRLERRNLAPTAVALTAALASEASAAPPTIVAATVQAASMLVLGDPLTQVGVSAAAMELTQGVLSDMFRTKMKIGVVALVVLAGLGLGSGKLAQSALSSRAEAAPVPKEADKPPEKEAAPPLVRKLDVKPDPKNFSLDGPYSRVRLTSEADALKEAGEHAAKQLAGLVDFKKEHVVLVRSSSGGPPFDTVEAEIKKVAGKYEVNFVTRPGGKPGQPRGRALRIGRDYFAIPADVALTPLPPPAERVKDVLEPGIKRAPEQRKDEKNEDVPAVRELTIKRGDKKIAGKGNWAIEVLRSEKEAAVYGEAIVKQITDQVDFAREKVVVVHYGSGGPPFDTIIYKLKKVEGGQEIVFSMRPSLPAGVPRGQAFLIAWYAIPQSVNATPTPPEEKK